MGQRTSISLAVDVQDVTIDAGQAKRGSARNITNVTLADGTTSGKADVNYSDPSRTLGAGASRSYDLSGALTDVNGEAAVFAKVKLIDVINSGPGVITLERPSSNGLVFLTAAGDSVPVQVGGRVSLYYPAGVTVTAGTGDLLDITADGSGATFSLIVVGTSA